MVKREFETLERIHARVSSKRRSIILSAATLPTALGADH
jgi:hypothetical protein